MFVSKNFGELLYPCGNPTVKTLTKISGESWQLVTAIPDEGDAHNTQECYDHTYLVVLSS